MDSFGGKKNKEDRMEEIKRSLYGREFSDPKIIEPMPRKKYDVVGEWQRKDPPVLKPQKKMPLLVKLLIGAAVFFVIAGGIALWRIMSGATFSASNVSIEVNGPISIASGTPLGLDVAIVNHNQTPIEDAKLYVEYPDGSFETIAADKALVRTETDIGNLVQEETVKETYQSVLFGAKDSKKEIKFTLQFRFQGSSATLSREEDYTVSLSSSPLDLGLDLHQESIIGQEETLTVHVHSNSQNVLSGLMLSVDYPTGFHMTDADPDPSANTNVWTIGDLAPGADRTFTIKGTFDGKDGDEKNFTASVGKANDAGDRVASAYTSINTTTTLRNASLALSLLFNGVDQDDYVSTSGDRIRVDVAWKNTLPVKIENAQITLKLSGDALNRYSVLVDKDGFYRSVDNTVLWNGQSLPALLSIEPGATGSVSFSLGSNPDTQNTPFTQNPTIGLDLSATGKSVDPDGTPKDVAISLAQKTIDIQTNASLAASTLYYTGPFTNNGPIPPKAEQRTTYTILWTVSNSSSDIRNGKVTATLPPYVEWLGAAGSGFNEDISYNPVGGVVTWNVGDVKAGTGVVRPARQAAFQVAFTPSISQINDSPDLTSDITFSGEDAFTKATISRTVHAVSTRLTNDPPAPQNSDRVVQ